MVYPRSDGRFVSRGYGWATLTDPGHEKKGMKAALELDGLVIDEVSEESVYEEEGGRKEGGGKGRRKDVELRRFFARRELICSRSSCFPPPYCLLSCDTTTSAPDKH